MYLLNPKIWKFKFQKLAYTWQALKAYSKIWQNTQRLKAADPNKQFICILLAEHLGDIVASTPIISALKNKYPNAHISWIVKPAYACLLENHPELDQIIPEKNLLSSIWLSKKNPFDQFLNLHLNELRKDHFYKIELENPKADELKLTYKNYYHLTNLLEVFSNLSGLNLSFQAPKIYTTSDNQPNIDNYWVIHTKSSDKARDWQKEKWNDLLYKIWEKYPVQIVEIGTEGGLDCSDPKFTSLIGKTNIKQTINWIKHASFFIGLDSGPTHIANAFQIPGLVICGKYKNFVQYMPYSGAYLKQEIATIYFNDGKTPAEHSVEDIYKSIEKTYLKSQVELLEH